MIGLYRKNPLFFALYWIAGYVFLVSVTDTISAHLGVQQVLTLPALLAVALVLFAFIRKNGLSARFGLCRGDGACAPRTFYLAPLAVIASSNLWGGVAVNFRAYEAAIIILSMLLVGFVEEVIFRGFLFRAMAEKNLRMAVVISSVTFGLGHIFNLLTQASVLETVLQIGYATSIGFLFTILFVKCGSIVPCIVAHGVMNALVVFAAPGNWIDHSIQASILIVVSLGYAICLLKTIPGTALQKK